MTPFNRLQSPESSRALSSGAGRANASVNPAYIYNIGEAFALPLIGTGSDREHSPWGDIAGTVRCGETIGIIRCANGHTREAIARCRRQMCPTCKHLWIREAAEAISARLDAAARLWSATKFHLVFSLRDAPTTKKAYITARKNVVALAKRLGVLGGVLVPHRRGTGLHFHCSGLVKEFDLSTVGREYGKTGIVSKFVRDIKASDRLAAYELDHCIKPGGEDDRMHTVTYFGVMNSKHLEVVVSETTEVSECATCGAPEHEERVLCLWDGGTYLDPPHAVHRRVYSFIRRSGKG